MKKKVEYRVPKAAEKIKYQNGEIEVPDSPVIAFIIGDGTGPELWDASVRVFDAAVAKLRSVARGAH